MENNYKSSGLLFLTIFFAIASFIIDLSIINMVEEGLKMSNLYKSSPVIFQPVILSLIPTILMSLTALSIVKIYEKLIWPFSSVCKRGWYVYALHRTVKTLDEKSDIKIIGAFYISHRIIKSTVPESYVRVYTENPESKEEPILKPETHWISDMVQIEGNAIKIVFEKIKEPGIENRLIYNGYIRMKEKRRDENQESVFRNNNNCYYGYLEDVVPNFNVRGYLYIEKIPITALDYLIGYFSGKGFNPKDEAIKNAKHSAYKLVSKIPNKLQYLNLG